MKIVADLHIHSHFSRATSKDLTFEHLARWAQLKGIQVVGTGDIAHPGWLQEMKDKLEPAEEGLFRLKADLAAAVQQAVPPACQGPVRFMLAGEISNIYKKNERTRKIHNVVFAPDLAALEKFQAALERIGNIRSDGRPILGLDSRDLLEIALEVDARCHLIPAHIWTPWFALLGSKSGFDSVAECFDDLTPHIFALETGLSSDPPMNWRVSGLDGYTLVSNSDAHSPPKLGREATLFETELSYPALFDALRSADPAVFRGTVEFFPEEGKYHLDGHRKCGVCWDPVTTLAHQGLCPVCGKAVTVGVMHRVETLADRPPGERPPRARPFHSLIPLPEILGEILGVGAGSKQVAQEYERLLGRLGPELAILMDLPAEEITAAGGEQLATGIAAMRRGEVQADAGYDGEYGVIKLFKGVDTQSLAGQMSLFGEAPAEPASSQEEPVPLRLREQIGLRADLVESASSREEPAPLRLREQSGEPFASRLPGKSASRLQTKAVEQSGPRAGQATPASSDLLAPLNPAQREAVQFTAAPLIIVAGPGTGKTRTLTVRIAYAIQALAVPPEQVLAITFTNKASQEMAARLQGLLGEALAGRVTIKTFHAFGAWLLRSYGAAAGIDPQFGIATDEDRGLLLGQAVPELTRGEGDRFLAQIAEAKNRLLAPEAPELGELDADPRLPPVYQAYEDALAAARMLDFDDLIVRAVRLLEGVRDVRLALQNRFCWLSVDEYQDVNLGQYRLLRLLTADADNPQGLSEAGQHLCVIGDPDQAIYGFRGADRRYFMSFMQDYPGARQLALEQNYRSTQMILDAAAQVIARNPDRQAVRVWSEFMEQVRLERYQAPTDKAEAEYVVHRIEQMVGGTSYFSLDSGRVAGEDPTAAHAFGDFAVLYRLGAQSTLLVEAFTRSGIPFQSAGQAPLYTAPAVREVLAYLWLLANPHARPQLETILTAGDRGLSPAALARLWPLLDTGDSLVELWPRALAVGGWSPAVGERVRALAAFWPTLQQMGSQSAVALIEQVWDFVRAMRPADDQDEERIGMLRRRAAAFGAAWPAFLESTVLQSETDHYDPRADRVALMTLHAAKGLEFPVVFIVGCETGLLPYVRGDEPADIEEERRLFYVGMTRAQQKLILTHARSRFLFGQRVENPLSPFVLDIERALTELREAAPRPTGKKPEGVQLSLF